jgi:hypothetical protein
MPTRIENRQRGAAAGQEFSRENDRRGWERRRILRYLGSGGRKRCEEHGDATACEHNSGKAQH